MRPGPSGGRPHSGQGPRPRPSRRLSLVLLKPTAPHYSAAQHLHQLRRVLIAALVADHFPGAFQEQFRTEVGVGAVTAYRARVVRGAVVELDCQCGCFVLHDASFLCISFAACSSWKATRLSRTALRRAACPWWCSRHAALISSRLRALYWRTLAFQSSSCSSGSGRLS